MLAPKRARARARARARSSSSSASLSLVLDPLLPHVVEMLRLAEEAYAPNVEYELFRVVLAAEGEPCAAAVHVATDQPRAEVALRVLQAVPVEGELRPTETELKAASGLGCASLLGVALVQHCLAQLLRMGRHHAVEAHGAERPPL